MDKNETVFVINISMTGHGESNVVLGIRIKREDKVSTPLDPTIKLMPNTGKTVDQLEYSKEIGCLMYAMTSTRPYIVYAVGKLSRRSYSTTAWVFLLVDWCHFIGFISKLVLLTQNGAKFVDLAAAVKEAECAASLARVLSKILHWKVENIRSLEKRISPRLSAQVGYRDGIKVQHEVFPFQEALDLAIICSSKDMDTWLLIVSSL
ncbi:hypothetical protein Tco_1482166 [Tanacetum coccineum]